MPSYTPLAEQLRPTCLADVAGHAVLLREDGVIGRMFARKKYHSLILWGAPGTGKTTLARMLAADSGYKLASVSAVGSGVAELKAIFAEAAQEHAASGMPIMMFVDEIHRFNRAQQDAFLPHMEAGRIILLGATTENPSFALNNALLSRAQVVVLERLDAQALANIVARVEGLHGVLPITAEAHALLLELADGDARYLLNMCEVLYAHTGDVLDAGALATMLNARPLGYDKTQDEHYNLISALHKSLRGSDADAALYWLCRMLEGGEDPRYIARRLVRFASEDIGNADPQALPLSIAAAESYERLGSPEGELALAQAVVYLANAPRSNAVYKAYKAARKAARTHGTLAPPKHILNAPTSLMKQQGYGAGYAYDHDAPDGFSGQNYFPDTLAREQFYQPVARGFEREMQKRMDWFAKIRDERSKKQS